MRTTDRVVPTASTVVASWRFDRSATNASIVAMASRLLKTGPTAGQKYLRREFSKPDITDPAPYRTTWMAK